MAVQLKQRLIGAVVLLALAVIALPMLLDRTSSRVTQLQSAIPTAPGKPVMPVLPKVVMESPVNATVDVPEPVESTPQTTVEPEPVTPNPTQAPLSMVNKTVPVTELTTTPMASVNLTGKKPVTTLAPETKPSKQPTKLVGKIDLGKAEPTVVVAKTPVLATEPKEVKTKAVEVREEKLSPQARQALALFADEPPPVSGSPDGAVVKVIPKKASSMKQNAWVVQLAGFKNTENAEKLVLQLQRKGYRAFVDTSMSGLARVMVGPETDRTRLDNQLPRIEQDIQLKGMVRPYAP